MKTLVNICHEITWLRPSKSSLCKDAPPYGSDFLWTFMKSAVLHRQTVSSKDSSCEVAARLSECGILRFSEFCCDNAFLNWLTYWSRVFGKLTAPSARQEITPPFMGPEVSLFITMLTRAHHWSPYLSWWIQSWTSKSVFPKIGYFTVGGFPHLLPRSTAAGLPPYRLSAVGCIISILLMWMPSLFNRFLIDEYNTNRRTYKMF